MKYTGRVIALTAILLCAACADTQTAEAPAIRASQYIYHPGAKQTKASAFIYDVNAPAVRDGMFVQGM